MGREWYFNWGTKSSSKRRGPKDGGNGGGHRKSASPQVATAAAAAAAAGGCMNAVLHMFDFHHLQFCLHPHHGSFLPDDPTPLKGLEAPRNSLESITEEEIDDSLQTLMDIKIKTNRRDAKLKIVQAPRAKIEDVSSESSCSPAGARTPNLVARLMGLDILPESNNTTPRSSSSYSQISRSPLTKTSTPPSSRSRKSRTKSSYNNDVPGPRSLPETPRSSSSCSHTRRSTDVVDHHRLSLQINKENSIVKEMESSRPSCSSINIKRKDGRNYEEENRSPGNYAKQIMKQVRETVSRRVGVDITNTIAQREHRRDEHLLTSTTTKSTKSKKESSISSPRLKTSEASKKLSSIPENTSALEIAKFEHVIVLPTTLKQQVKPLETEDEKPLKQEQHCPQNKELNSKKFDSTKSCSKVIKKLPPKSFDSIRNKKDEQFVRSHTRANSSSEKKCKKTPLSSDLFHASVPSLVPLKKDSSSLPPTKLLEMQDSSSKAQLSKPITSIITSTNTNTSTRLSRSPSQRTYGKVLEQTMHTPADQGRKKQDTSTTSVAEFQYITRILKCTGIDRDTPIAFTRWFSASHPLDPSIFHSLEVAHYLASENLSLGINRRLVFHLVNELLVDILKHHIELIPWSLCFVRRDHQQQQLQINGFQLVKTLCTRIRSFPSSDCQTLQDIDALVEKDIPGVGVATNYIALEEEGDAIVSEVERDIMDSLVLEVAYFCLGNRSSTSMQKLC